MEDECQACRRNDPTHPVKMHFSDCGHSLCDVCFKTNFKEHSRSYHCSVCRLDLGRADFFDKPRDEREYERQRQIRQKVLAVYNEEEEDFPSRELYDRYLESVEDLIERLMAGQSTPALQEQMESYEKENKSQILVRKTRREQAKKALRRDAIIEDSIYDESKREEAQILRKEIEEEEESKLHRAKEMPDCENLDSSCSLSELETAVRALFLRASGCDFGIAETCGSEELRDGLKARNHAAMQVDS